MSSASPPSSSRAARRAATRSMSRDTSQPTHAWPARSSAAPERPLPQPTSRTRRRAPAGKFSNSTQRAAISACTRMMRLLDVYLAASVAS